MGKIKMYIFNSHVVAYVRLSMYFFNLINQPIKSMYSKTRMEGKHFNQQRIWPFYGLKNG